MKKSYILMVLTLLFLMPLKANAITVGKEYDFPYKTDNQPYEFIVPQTGTYKFEAWGAAGGAGMNEGAHNSVGGAGAYTSGEITLTKGTAFYIYVGGKGKDAVLKANAAGGFNGGGTGIWDNDDDEAAGGGGGATDFRYIRGTSWNDFDSLKTRIMVAAGGGGGVGHNAYNGGAGGTLSGEVRKYAQPGTQTGGYAFGYGGAGVANSYKYEKGGGGGGYYGGQAGTLSGNYGYASGAGGSSFVSGCEGCNAILESSISSRINHSGNPEHYGGYVFDNIIMFSGNEDMPQITNSSTMIGNASDGYARVTFVGGPSTITDITFDNEATLLDVISASRFTYHVLVPSTVYTTNLTITTKGKTDIIGDGNIILTEGEKHNVIVMDELGNVFVYEFIPTVYEYTTVDVEFDELDFEFDITKNTYNLSVDYNIRELTPNVTCESGAICEVIGDTELSVGKNEIKVKVTNTRNEDIYYTFNIERQFYNYTYLYTFTTTWISNATVGTVRPFTAGVNGTYRLEAWGAGGHRGHATNVGFASTGGKGSYTSGDVYLEKRN